MFAQKFLKQIIMAKKKLKKKKIAPVKKRAPKKIVRGSSKYRAVQSMLSAYSKSKGIKLGKGFNSAASKIYKAGTGIGAKYIEQNIEQLYKEHVEPPKIEIPFPDDIPFYDFTLALQGPMFLDAKVSINFKDSFVNVSFEGSADEVADKYRSELHQHCRKYYNDSPVAIFSISKTDNKTFVDYVGQADGLVSDDELEGVDEVEDEVSEKLSPKDKDVSDIQKSIDLEKQKEKTIEKQLQLEKEKQKTADKALDLIKAGFTPEQVAKILGL